MGKQVSKKKNLHCNPTAVVILAAYCCEGFCLTRLFEVEKLPLSGQTCQSRYKDKEGGSTAFCLLSLTLFPSQVHLSFSRSIFHRYQSQLPWILNAENQQLDHLHCILYPNLTNPRLTQIIYQFCFLSRS